MIPHMSDADLSSLRVNAERLVQHGLPGQVVAASEILPLIDGELVRRAALPKAAPAPRVRVARKKIALLAGHQTALPSKPS
jgi:hypothetical protein